MQPLRIFDQSFNLLGEIDNYESLVITRKHFTYNDFHVQINANKQNTEHLRKGNILLPGTDFSKAAIIRQVEKNLDEGGKGSEVINVTAYGLCELFTRRITLPPSGSAADNITADGESVIKHYIANNITAPTDADRQISLVNMLANQNRGLNAEWGSRYKKLNEELTKIAKLAGLGLQMSLNYDTLKFDFDVVAGRDLTTSQTANNPVIFSYEFDNIQTQSYTHSDIDEKNIGYVGGEGEGTARTIEEVGTSTGLDRKEIFIDARNVDISLAEKGSQELAEKNVIETLEGQVLTYGPFEYEVDWVLGDVVTVKNSKRNIEMESTITEVREIYEPNNFELDVTFGEKPKDIVDKMKAELDRVNGDVTK